MKIFLSSDAVLSELQGGIIAIGVFDGLHLGHQALLKKLNSSQFGKRKRGVFTFAAHPKEFLENKDIFYLSDYEQKLDILRSFNLDVLIVQKPHQEFLNFSADEFIKNILQKNLKVKDVIVGEDFRFGKHALGDAKYLSSQASLLDIKVHVMPLVELDGARCSSSHIRMLLMDGRVDEANKFLGRVFSIRGQVRSGLKIGTSLKFPTANIDFPKNCGLRKGVYVSTTKILSNKKDFLSVTNVGQKPTLANSSQVTIETHLLDEQIDLYGETIEIFFASRLRDEKKFSSLKELQEQIALDISCARKFLNKVSDGL